MNKHSTPTRQHQQGSILVLFGGLILVLTGFAVLAIDVGRVFIVRSELQTVADASALAGAICLTRQSGTSATDCLSTLSTSLNWDRATAKARAQLSQNQADNRSISSTDAGNVIDVGYWDMLNKRPSGGTLPTSALLTNFSPLGSYDMPAIRVKVSKTTGQNSGPILMLPRLMFGGSDVSMSATAVAAISSPGSVLSGTLAPMVINQCMYKTYWNTSSNTPRTATAKTLNGVAQVIGQPWVLRIGSAYHYGSCDSGQWTTFGNDTDSASDLKQLINTGNPDTLSIGDGTYIQSGTKTSAYTDLNSKYPNGADVLVPVVNYPSGLDGVKSSIPIIAFALFHITDIQSGDKFIEGYFKAGLPVSGATGFGPSYGAYTPPRLAY